MKNLRALHLYLGCIFAPLLLFFAISGIWQTLGIHSNLLNSLSTIHTAHHLKIGGGLAGPLMKVFVLVMAVSFVLTTVLGVIMAIKHGGKRRTAYVCLVLGVVFPLALVLFKA